MNNISAAEAIRFLMPNSEFRIIEDDLSTLEFYSPKGQVHPTQAEINNALKDLVEKNLAEEQAKAAQKQLLLDRLGITQEEAQLLLGGN